MRLSDLQNKNIINITDGTVVGNIIDVEITNDGTLDALIVEKNKLFVSLFTNGNELTIKWNQIEKVGEDVILVKVTI